MSGVETWGRWSDANVSPTVKFQFKQSLPTSFTLVLEANAFGPNQKTPITIRAGKVSQMLIIDGAPAYSLEFKNVKSDLLEIVPPKPTAPKDVDPPTPDSRKLGIGLITLKIK